MGVEFVNIDPDRLGATLRSLSDLGAGRAKKARFLSLAERATATDARAGPKNAQTAPRALEAELLKTYCSVRKLA